MLKLKDEGKERTAQTFEGHEFCKHKTQLWLSRKAERIAVREFMHLFGCRMHLSREYLPSSPLLGSHRGKVAGNRRFGGTKLFLAFLFSVSRALHIHLFHLWRAVHDEFKARLDVSSHQGLY